MFFHFHPYEPFLNKETKTLIVGTLPPPRFCTKEYKENDVLFCYGSQDGLLWPVLDKIFQLNLVYNHSKNAINQRKEFLIKNQIGICDIVASCKREKIDASDLGMEDIQLRPLIKYIKENENICNIIFTGGNSKNGPEYFFRKQLKEYGLNLKIIQNEIPRIHQVKIDNKTIKTISLTSPSNAANRAIGANEYYKKRKKENPSYTTFDFRFEQYKKVFLEYI